MVTDEELKKVYGMFTDAWKFYKKYADVQQSDEYWETLIAEANAIAKKYQNNKLCRDLIIAVMSELERKSKYRFITEIREGDSYTDLLLSSMPGIDGKSTRL